jgi:glycerophosphoryl diester phosphodiesterase
LKKKTKIIAAAAASAVIVITAVCIGISAFQNKKIQPMETFNISKTGIKISDMTVSLIAQGGLSALAPEDTYYSVEKAGREGFITVEIDVHETLDGMWVLMKDNTINRMTDGCGKIKNYTFYELLNFNVDNGANIADYPKTKIASLDQVLDLCGRYGIRPVINIEQGSTGGLENLVKILKKWDITQRCTVTSADKDDLSEMKRLSPKTEVWLVVDKLTKSNMAWLEANKGYGVDFNANQKANTDEKIKELSKAGIKISCSNVNTLETLKKLYALGIRSFCTECILPK